ncbi:hemagglutinin repeat-containing protein [Fusobacteria bacterium ZRK30]|nr:hemagglutinin repeat-containing protein [Fusobacteria bacterium ZRK30]
MKVKYFQKSLIYLYIFFSIFGQPIMAAGIVIDQGKNQQAGVENAPNGVPIVNINNPNKNGLSHNYFKEYNVENKGVLINNSKEENIRTQLGGLIQGNSNLGREANTILTEVTGINRSKLEGYTEIVGGAADYILANPNGIYVNGAGFINTPRVTLTTGRSVIDDLGNLKEFDIDNGSVVIGSEGIDGRNVRMVDIISRTAELNGAVYGGDELRVVLGRNKYNYDTGKVSKKEGGYGKKPKVALDGRALGSLYAGRIFIQSTEDGVGVNSQGEVLAGVEDFRINVNGDLVLRDAQAKKNIEITAKNTIIQEKLVGEEGIEIRSNYLKNNGKIGSNKSADILGNTLENNGEISSETLKVSSNTLKNQGEIVTTKSINILGNLTNEKEGILVSGEKISLKNIDNKGTISAVKSIDIAEGLVNNGDGTIIAEGTIASKNIDNEGTISAKNNIDIENNLLNKVEGSIVTEGTIDSKNIDNEGTISAKNNIDIKNNLINKVDGSIVTEGTIASKNIDNEGIISAVESIDITEGLVNKKGAKIVTSKEIRSNLIENSGIISGITGVKAGEGIVNNKEGILVSEGDIWTKNATNSGVISGEKSIKVDSLLENKSGGEILSEGQISLDNLKNSGIVSTTKDLLVNKTMENNNGKITTVGKIQSENTTNTGTISSQNDIYIGGELLNSDIGIIVSGRDIEVVGSLKNQGILSGRDNITINNTVNTGNIYSDGSIFLKELNQNKGTISGVEIEILNEGNLDNKGGKITTGKDSSKLSIRADKIENQNGEILSQGDLIVNTGELTVDGRYVGNKKIDINTTNFINNGLIEGLGIIEISAANNFVNNKDKIIIGNSLKVEGKNFTNNGLLGGAQNSTLTIGSSMVNNSEMSLGSGSSSISVTSGDIRNYGFLTGKGNIKLKGLNIVNSGQIASGNNLTLSGRSILNNEGMLIYSGGDMVVSSSGNVKNNRGELYSGGDMKIVASGKVSNIVGDIEAIGDIEIKAGSLENIGEVTGTHSVEKESGLVTNIDQSQIDKNPIENQMNITMNQLYENNLSSKGSWTWFRGLSLYKTDKIISNYVSYLSYISSGNNIKLEITDDIINREGNILANNNINIKARNLYNENMTKDVKIKLYWKKDYELHGAAMYQLDHDTYYLNGKVYNGNRDKGYILAESDAIQKVGGNKASKISAGGNMSITATKIGNGVLSNDKNIVNSNNTNIGNVVLNNNKVEINSALENEKIKGTVGGEGSLLDTVDTEDYIKIPSGDKGMFVVNDLKSSNKPGFSYLIETNVKFVDMSYYLGSDYFFGKIGYNPEKDIRLLGDAFYETRVVNRAILENTGARYLNGATNEKDQMKMLFDNSVVAMDDLELSLGVALTKAQINNLKEDIVWYVEKKVNGVDVLVPKVYLSKETLASLEGSNRTGLSAGDKMEITALELDNTGVIKSDGDLKIDIDSLLNKTIKGGGIAKIVGNNISIVSANDIDNIGAAIKAKNDLILESVNGKISNINTKRVNTNIDQKIRSSLENTGVIEAGNNIKISGDKIINIGSEIKGKRNVELEGNEVVIGSDEIYNYEKKGGSKNYTIKESVRNKGSLVSGENVSLSAKKNIDVIGSDIAAEKNLSLEAGNDINITATIDSDYYEKQKTREKSWGRGKTTTEIKYNENLNSSNLVSGSDTLIVSGNNVNVAGSNVLSEGDISIGAVNNVNISSAMKGSIDSKQSVKSGFMGLSGRSQKEVETKYTNVGSNIGSVGNLEIQSKNGNINILGSDIESGGDILLDSENNVNIMAVDDITKKQKQKTKYGTSLFGSVDGPSIEVGISTSIEKNKNTSLDTKVVGSNISSDGDIKIISGNNTNVEASDIVGNNVDIEAVNEINIIGRDEIHSSSEKNEKGEIKLSVGVDLSGIKDTFDSMVNATKGIKDLPEVVNVASSLISGKDLNESLAGNEGGLNAINNIINGPSSEGTSAGIYGKIELSKDESSQDSTNRVGSTITANNDVTLKTDNGNMNFEGAKVTAGNDISLDSGENINIISGESTNKGESSSMNISGELNFMTGQISGGIGGSKGSNSETIHSNSEFIAGNKVDISGEDLTIKGGNIIGNEVEIDIDNLVIESVQDTGKSKNIGININASGGGDSSLSGGIGVNYSDYEKEWVNNQSSIIGIENSEITINGNTNIVGGLLGGGNTTLDTGSLTFTDIKDKDKGMDIGINGNLSRNKIEGGSEYEGSVGGNYGALDREQTTRATIGDGKVIVGGGASIFHNIERDTNGKLKVNLNLPNEKYMNTKGEEVVFNKKTGKVIKDGINDGTYNIAGGEVNINGPRDIYLHTKGSTSDVKLWIKYGTGRDDPTTREERETISKQTFDTHVNLVLKPQVDAAKENLKDKDEYFEGE